VARVTSNLPRLRKGTDGGYVASSGVSPGIAPVTGETAIAPWPQVDRTPIIVGTNITMQYIASCMRTALTGYRMQYVDLLSEFLDHEPKGLSELNKRIVSIASARYEIVPVGGAKPEPDAVALADMVRAQIEQIPFWCSALYRLAFWGELSGVGCEEIIWRTGGGDPDEYTVDKLQSVHSRRLSYPNWMLWDLHIWDQGMGGGYASDPTNFGLRVADFPTKFVAHTPTLRGEYASREGLGRTLCTFFALKRLVLRCAGQDFERFIKPWVVAYYCTGNMASQGKSRTANKNDIAMADAAMKGVGAGSLAGVTLPDSVKIELLRAVTAMSPVEFLRYLDESITMLMQGQNFTSSPGEVGARAASEVSAGDTTKLLKFAVGQTAETIRATLVRAIVTMNRPGMEHLVPLVRGHLDAERTPKAELELATMAANAGLPVDGKVISRRVDVPIIDPGEGAQVRLAPLAPVDPARILPDGSVEEMPEPAPAGAAPAEKEKLT